MCLLFLFAIVFTGFVTDVFSGDDVDTIAQ